MTNNSTLSKEDFEKIFEIFKIESDEHIQKLNSGILSLEEKPDNINIGLIEEIFREAHSLKGAARMISFKSIENIAHHLETIIEKIRKNEIFLSTEITNLILKSLDTVDKIIKVISQGGKEEDVNSSQVLEALTQIVKGKIMPETDTGSQYKDRENARADMNLFFEETTDAHQKFVNSLSLIEKSPDNGAAEINNAYNQIHALKGSARIVGHAPMGDLSFLMEQSLSLVINKKIELAPSLIAALIEGAGLIKIFINEIKKGEAITDHSAFKKVASSLNSFLHPHIIGENISSTHKTSLQSKNTVRVSSEKLDRLIDQSSELLIIKSKTSQRPIYIQSIINRCNKLKHSLKGEKNIANNGAENLKEKYENEVAHIIDHLDFLYKTFSDDNRQLSLMIEKIQDDIKKTRLFPFNTILDSFPKMVRELAISKKKKIKYEVSGGDIELDKHILEEIKDPLMHMLRNSVDHGIETPEERIFSGKPRDGNIQIRLSQKGSSVSIEVEDDGRGLDVDCIKASAIKRELYLEKDLNQMKERQVLNLIFHPGFSTSDSITDVSGRGIGMDVVKSTIERLNGTVDIQTVKNKGTKFILTIPLSISTTRAIKISVCDEIFFLPINMVDKIISVSEKDLTAVEGEPAVRYRDSNIPYVHMASILNIPEPEDSNNTGKSTAILRAGNASVAFAIDKFFGEEEIIVKGLGNHMKRVRNVSGVTIMNDGRVAPILNVNDMINTVQLRGITPSKKKIKEPEIRDDLSILIVDDSIMTRTLEKNILESHGYKVTTAVDGQDALFKLGERSFDIIVSDVQMPNMNGLELTEKIKQNSRYKKIPVILVSALESDDDKKRGMLTGADAYIVKSSFDQSNLLNAIKRLTRI